MRTEISGEHQIKNSVVHKKYSLTVNDNERAKGAFLRTEFSCLTKIFGHKS